MKPPRTSRASTPVPPADKALRASRSVPLHDAALPARPAESLGPVLRASRLASPLGDLFVVVDERGALVRLDFVDVPESAPASRRASATDSELALERALAAQGSTVRWDEAAAAPVARALERYFTGEREGFQDLAVAPAGTEFQRAVWTALRTIPWGRTESYAALARRVGRPGAARAVGLANGRNPIAIIVPCHRVIGADGSLTGYGGGLERKRALLELERVLLPAPGGAVGGSGRCA